MKESKRNAAPNEIPRIDVLEEKENRYEFLCWTFVTWHFFVYNTDHMKNYYVQVSTPKHQYHGKPIPTLSWVTGISPAISSIQKCLTQITSDLQSYYHEKLIISTRINTILLYLSTSFQVYLIFDTFAELKIFLNSFEPQQISYFIRHYMPDILRNISICFNSSVI